LGEKKNFIAARRVCRRAQLLFAKRFRREAAAMWGCGGFASSPVKVRWLFGGKALFGNV